MPDFDLILFFEINLNGLEWSLCDNSGQFGFSQFIGIIMVENVQAIFEHFIGQIILWAIFQPISSH